MLLLTFTITRYMPLFVTRVLRKNVVANVNPQSGNDVINNVLKMVTDCSVNYTKLNRVGGVVYINI